MANILNIGSSALTAAQVGLATTSHNIANASTVGYNRQIVLQGAVGGQGVRYGFPGGGTEVLAIRRVYDEFVGNQVVAAQTSRSQLAGFRSQIEQMNGILADPKSGLSPPMQDFFNGVQAVSADPNGTASRQSMLSSAESLASRFQSLDGQMREIGDGVNAQIATSVNDINGLAQRIAGLNNSIELAQGGRTGTANDLMDQRDQAINELSQQVKVNVVKQGNSFNVSIGNGQPLVVGITTYSLAPVTSKTDPARLEVAYVANGVTTELGENTFASGGKLGGLMDFRANSLDPARNSLGRVAIAMGTAFNAQHALGQDQTGALGGQFFNVATPVVSASIANTGTGVVTASVTNVNALSSSDYRLQFIPAAGAAPASYKVTRLSDGVSTSFPPPSGTVDGVGFSIAGTPAATDNFIVRPTVNGASLFSVAIKDTTGIAAAAPIRAAESTGNVGTAKITPPVVNSTAMMSGVAVTYAAGTNSLTGFPATNPVTVTIAGTPPTSNTYAAGAAVPYTSGATYSFGGANSVISGALADGATVDLGPPAATLRYDGTTKTLSGFPPNLPVSVTSGGATTVYGAGVPVPYTSGSTISYGGISFSLSGAASDADTFKISANTTGVGDSRNALLLGGLQTAKVLDNGTASLQGAYSKLVNVVGNKTREVQATGAAAEKLYSQAVATQQSQSGVNLDEEATNLMRYQQAYQAAGKVMQTASQLFDVLLSLGG